MSTILERARALLEKLGKGTFPELADLMRQAIDEGKSEETVLKSLRDALASWQPFLPQEMRDEVHELREEVERLLRDGD